jgi:hypothetical protein
MAAKRVLALLPWPFLFPYYTRLYVQRSRRTTAAQTRYLHLKFSYPLGLPLHNCVQLSDPPLLNLHTLVQLQQLRYQFFSCQIIQSAHTDLLHSRLPKSCINPMKFLESFVVYRARRFPQN